VAEADKLLSTYSTHPDIVKAVRSVAGNYYDTKHYAEAAQLFRAAVTNWPAADTLWCQEGLTCSLIWQGDISAAVAAADKLFIRLLHTSGHHQGGPVGGE